MHAPRMNPNKKYPMAIPDGKGSFVEVKQLVHLNQVIQHPRIHIGDYTYYHSFKEVTDYAGEIAPFLFLASPEQLRIGKFCQIASGSQFITSSANHDMSGFSTYPFANFMMDAESTGDQLAAIFEVPGNKGDTLIGNDVWIGCEAIVMPGVTIGDGAIVGTRSVVTKDVAPYSIVGGNPAREVRVRFDYDTVVNLLDVRWWDWPIEKIESNLQAIRSCDIQQLNAAR